MNKIMKLMGCFILLATMASCSEDMQFYKLETPQDQMSLKASVESVVLEKSKEEEEAISFTWHDAARRGEEGATTSYFFRMYMADMPTNVTKLYDVPEGEHSMAFTHKELNELLASWNVLPGDEVTLEAQVIAQIHSAVQYLKPELSKFQFNATGYNNSVEALYLVMIADDGSRTVKRMGEKAVGSAIYQAEVDWAPCRYFFALDANEDYPRYVQGTERENSLQLIGEGGTGEMFKNTLIGVHTVVVDLNLPDVNVYQIYPLPADGIWIVGNATTIGWDWRKMKQEGAFRNDVLRHPERWTYTGMFYGPNTEFKLSLEPYGGDFAGKFFFAPTNLANPMEEHQLGKARYQHEGGDLKWTVPTSGQYTLTVDLYKMEIHLTPVE